MDVEKREAQSVQEKGKGSVTLLADLILIQVETRESLQLILYIASWWSGRSDAEW